MVNFFKKYPLATVDGRFKNALKEWDSGSHTARQRILEDLVRTCEGKTASELEAKFGNAASLFFARVLASVHLTAPLGQSCDLLLKAIAIFLASASGHRFVVEFIEAGGVHTLLDVLETDLSSESDKLAAVKVLAILVRLGRKYKELICADGGVEPIARCLGSEDDDLREAAQRVLEALATANPLHSNAVQRAALAFLHHQASATQRTAAMLLRTLELEVPPSTEYVPLGKQLLRSIDVQVQYEGKEFLKMTIKYEHLRELVLKELVEALVPSVNVIAEVTRAEERVTSYTKLLARSQRHMKEPPPAFVLQASAARLIGELAASSIDIAVHLLEVGALQGLVVAAANMDYNDAQVASCVTLRLLAKVVIEAATALRKHIGAMLFERLMVDPEGVARSMTKETADIFRHGGGSDADETDSSTPFVTQGATLADAIPVIPAIQQVDSASEKSEELETDSDTEDVDTLSPPSFVSALPPVGLLAGVRGFARSYKQPQQENDDSARLTEMIDEALQQQRTRAADELVADASRFDSAPPAAAAAATATAAAIPSRSVRFRAENTQATAGLTRAATMTASVGASTHRRTAPSASAVVKGALLAAVPAAVDTVARRIAQLDFNAHYDL